MTYDLDLWPTDLNINRDHLIIQGLSTYQDWSFWGKAFASYQLHKVWAINMNFDLDLWPSDMKINKDHLLILDYLPTKFEACMTKHCWVISCTRYRRSTWPLTLTFDLNINRDHLLIKYYLPTKFEASGAKRSWVIRCTRFGRLTWPLTLTFDLLTWISIGIIYSSRTIYLLSLKYLGQSILELSVAQGLGDWHDLWPWPLTYWPDYQ